MKAVCISVSPKALWWQMLALCGSLCATAQNEQIAEPSRDTLRAMEHNLATLVVEATRANERTPVSYSNLGAEQIRPLNTGQDLPYVLRFTPSLVVTSDAGNGVGYTGLWIRGSDPSRINISINGIPLNDPESQQVFWVNTPDFISSTREVQIQRGVGTSANGAASFGGHIKLETSGAEDEAYARTVQSVGSFGTRRHAVAFGTGWMGEAFSLEGRLSRILSDGYIDRAHTDLGSFFLQGTWRRKKSSLSAVVFGGREETYQSWFGTPHEKLFGGSREDLLDFAGRNAFTQAQTENLLNSGRTYNFYTYGGQVDRYGQDHAQLHYALRPDDRWSIRVSAHYTRGSGYFEEFREADDRTNYGLDPVLLASAQVAADTTDESGAAVSQAFQTQFPSPFTSFAFQPVFGPDGQPVLTAEGDTLLEAGAYGNTGDLVRRRWLDNHFYGVVFSASRSTQAGMLTIGGAASEYRGVHFGEIISMDMQGLESLPFRYYEGRSVKRDANLYARMVHDVGERWSLYGDVQVRLVDYRTHGTDNDLRQYVVDDFLPFFNPKAGVTFRPDRRSRVYLSAAMGHKEPNRNDYVDAQAGMEPRREQMLDFEGGYQRAGGKYAAGVNVYFMDYRDQLVLTGELNDVGAPLRTNVPSSYRAGVEMEFSWHLSSLTSLDGNLTLSRNRIRSHEQVMYDYTDGFAVRRTPYRDTPISFSPSVVAMCGLSHRIPLGPSDAESRGSRPYLEAAWVQKWVGEQYLDNTGNRDVMLPAYTTGDARLSWIHPLGRSRELRVDAWLNNALNAMYASNGYAFSYVFGETVTERFYYPQAGRNWMFGLSLGF